MIAIDLSKQQPLHADPKAIQQINFIANLYQDRNAAMVFIIEKKIKFFKFFYILNFS